MVLALIMFLPVVVVCIIVAIAFIIVAILFLIVVPMSVARRRRSMSPVFRVVWRMVVVSEPIVDLVIKVVMHVLVGDVIFSSSLVAVGVLTVFLVP